MTETQPNTNQNLHSVGGGESTPLPEDSPYPLNLKNAVDRVRKLRYRHERMPHGTRQQALAKAEFYRDEVQLAERWASNLQQGLPICHGTEAKHLDAMHARRVNGPVARAERLSLLQQAIASGKFIPGSDLFEPLQVTVDDAGIHRLFDDPESTFRALAFTARQELAKYAVTFLESWSLAFPEDRKEELLLAMRTTRSPEEISALHTELQIVTGPGARTISQSMRGALSNSFAPTQDAIQSLLAEAIRRVTAYREQALEDERRFFAVEQLPVERTGFGKRFDVLLAKLKHHGNGAGISSMQPTAGAITDPSQTVLTTLFGIAI